MHTRTVTITFVAAMAGCFTDSPSTFDTDTDAGSETSTTGESTGEDGSTSGESSTSASTTDESESDGSSESGSETGDPLPDPIAWYRFDGSLFDASGNDYDAEDPNELVTYEPSPAGMAARFGVGAYLRVAGIGDAIGTGAPLTVVASVRLDVETNQDALLSIGDGASEDQAENLTMLHLFQGRALLLTETGDGENHSADLAAAPAAGEWAEVAWVLDGSEVAFFIDGVEVGRESYTPADSQPSDAFIGGSPTAESVDGLVDELAVYDVALESPGLP